MKKIELSLVIVTILLVVFVSASVVLSDQGSDVVIASTGETLQNGNLTIQIYDSASGGNLVYEETFENAISNGSWNVILEGLNLDYGKVYYKNYLINDDDMNFNEEDRIEFTAPSGNINVSSDVWIGEKLWFSLGSFIENTVGGWLGLNGNVNVTGNLNVAGNVSIQGNSLKVGNKEVCLSDGTNCVSNSTGIDGNSSFNQALTDSLYAPISIIGDNSSWNESYANTKYASTGIIGGNESWNESFADGKYVIRTEEGELNVNYADYANSSSWWAGLDSWIEGWFVKEDNNLKFNETKLNETIDLRLADLDESSTIIAVNDSLWDYITNNENNWNSNYNVTYAGYVNSLNETNLVLSTNTTTNIQNLGFYSKEEIDANLSKYILLTDTRFNETVLILNVNSSIWDYINSNQANWLSTYNATYASFVSGNASWNESYANTKYAPISVTGDNASWNKSYADTLFVSSENATIIGLINNASYLSTYNSSYDSSLGTNWTLTTYNTYDVRWASMYNASYDSWNANYSVFSGLLNNASYLSTYNVSYSSFNTTLNIQTLYNATVAVFMSLADQHTHDIANITGTDTNACSGTDKVSNVTLLNGDLQITCTADETGSGEISSPPPVKFMNILAGAVTDTNSPAAERIAGNSWYVVCTNATSYRNFRFGTARATTNGAASWTVNIKYISSPTTTITASSWTYLNSPSSSLSVTAQNTAQISPYYSMNSNLDEICLAAFTSGGDGVLDPQWRNIWVELT